MEHKSTIQDETFSIPDDFDVIGSDESTSTHTEIVSPFSTPFSTPTINPVFSSNVTTPGQNSSFTLPPILFQQPQSNPLSTPPILFQQPQSNPLSTPPILFQQPQSNPLSTPPILFQQPQSNPLSTPHISNLILPSLSSSQMNNDDIVIEFNNPMNPSPLPPPNNSIPLNPPKIIRKPRTMIRKISVESDNPYLPKGFKPYDSGMCIVWDDIKKYIKVKRNICYRLCNHMRGWLCPEKYKNMSE